ncbi:MAG TPA: hypothetical protein VJ505_12470 [Holophagaceae bacterium]|nr:hypothetical protein [Holophagaceae bacterium]
MRPWITLALAAGLLTAQDAPKPEPKPAPEPQPAAQAAPAAPAPAPAQAPAVAETPAPANAPFDQWRPSQRKLAFMLNRAALAGHELGYYQSHPKAGDVRAALEALLAVKADLPEKAAAGIPAAEAYLGKVYAAHGLYVDGTKLLMEGTFKDLQKAAQAAGKLKGGKAVKGLESKFAKLKGLMFDAKVDATAPTWAEPEAPKKGKKKAKAPKAPEGFAAQKQVAIFWLKRAVPYLPNTRQEVEVKGEKKSRLAADPVQVKAVNDLVAFLEQEDVAILHSPALAHLDLRRLGAGAGVEQGRLGQGLLEAAPKVAAGTAPEGAPAALKLLPRLTPVMGESKFSKGDEKRAILGDVKLEAPAASLAEQMMEAAKLGRSKDLDVK